MKSIFYVEETFLYLHYQSFSLGNRGSNETIAFLESAPRKTIMERVIQKRKGIPNCTPDIFVSMCPLLHFCWLL
eukprot:GAHX01003142.1.p1 GENE.GAHX01003142.1~~GAHX01003142.1.p1  ORF type:complete len:74 (-),score=5.75 GAHX01003142.1:321-542(-)